MTHVGGSSSTSSPVSETHASRSNFGEALVAGITPTIQYACPYGYFNTQLVEKYTYGTGSTITAADGATTLTCGSDPGSYASLISLRNCKYRPGEAVVCRFTAAFTANAPANSQQLAGLGTAGNGFFIGMNEDAFGVMRRSGGRPAIWTLVVSSAFTSAQTITVQLNSVNYTFTSANAGGSLSFTGHQFEAVAGAAWDVEHLGSTVRFIHKGIGPLAGSFSINWNSSGGAGTFTEMAEGVAATETWTYQENFSGELDNIDLTKLNVYEVMFGWLGSSNIRFFIQDPGTGDFRLFHNMRYTNKYITPSVENPSLRMLYAVYNGSGVSLKFASFYAGIAGPVVRREPYFSREASRSILATTETVVLTIFNGLTYNGRVSHSELYPSYLSLATDGSKTVVFRIYKNATVGANTSANFTDYSSISANSTAYIDTTADTLTNGNIIYTFVLAKIESRTIPLTDLVSLLRGESLTITAYSTAINDVQASISWVEDQ